MDKKESKVLTNTLLSLIQYVKTQKEKERKFSQIIVRQQKEINNLKKHQHLILKRLEKL